MVGRERRGGLVSEANGSKRDCVSRGRGTSSGRGISTVMLYNRVLSIRTRMSDLYDAIMSRAADSEYIDPEHVWPLGIGCAVVLIALVDIRALNQLLASLDGFTQRRQCW